MIDNIALTEELRQITLIKINKISERASLCNILNDNKLIPEEKQKRVKQIIEKVN